MEKTMIKAVSVAFISGLLLAGCATGPTKPAPVESRELEDRVRDAARADSSGVQVRPLQNPATQELKAQAAAAEASGDLSRSAGLLEQALRIEPRDPELLQQMAELKLLQQDFQQALNFAIRSHDVGPRVGEICARNWRTIGLARERLGNQSGSAEATSRATNCMNTPPKAY